MRAISSSWWQLQAHPPSSEQQPSTWIIHRFKLKQFTDISRPDIIREAYTLQGLARPQLIIEFERYVWDLCPERVAWLHSRLSLYSPAEETPQRSPYVWISSQVHIMSRAPMCPVFETVKSIIILWIQNLDVTLKRWQPRAWLKAPHNYLLSLVFAYRFNKEFSSRMKNKSSQQKEKWWCWLGRNGLCLQVHSFAGNPLSLQHPNHTCWTRRAVQALRYLTTYWKNSKMEMSSSSIVFLKQCFCSRTISKSRTGALWVPVALAPAANSLHVREAILSTHWWKCFNTDNKQFCWNPSKGWLTCL